MQNLEQKIKSYQPPVEVKKLLSTGRVVFLVGVTGAGKDTIMQKLLQNNNYHQIVSHTTRKPRMNNGIMEVEGKDYFFIDLKEAERKIDNGEYIEVKWVHGKVNGTSVDEIKNALETGKIAIGDIEVQGVAEYRSLSDNVIPIFILPPNFDEWMRRFKKRYSQAPDPEDVALRLKSALFELSEAVTKPYYEIVINDDLDSAIKITDQIAHGNTSDRKNLEAHKVAEKILSDLKNYLKQN